MKIRKAKKDDLNQICELGYRLLKFHCRFRRYYTPISDAKERKKGQMRYFTKELKKRNSLFLVLDDDGKVAGYSIARIEKDPPVLKDRLHGNFAEIFIDDDYQGRGHGSQLIRMSLDWFRKRGVKRAIVDYDASNQCAEGFYRKAGFRPFQNRLEAYLK